LRQDIRIEIFTAELVVQVVRKIALDKRLPRRMKAVDVVQLSEGVVNSCVYGAAGYQHTELGNRLRKLQLA